MSAPDTLYFHPQIIQIKREARLLCRQNPQVSQSRALEVLARSMGFKTYAGFRHSLKVPQ